MKGQHGGAAVLASALLAVPAFAQDDGAADFRATGVTVRSGITAFTGDLGDETNVGGFLGVQVDAQPLRLMGIEVGYEGSANGFEESGSGSLWRHNLGALAKLGPIVDNRWQPFVGAGVGVSYIDPTGMADVTTFDNDFVFEVPLAAGLEYRFSNLTAGARATYRIMDGEAFAPGDVDEGDLFTAGFSLGGRF
jgi:opacity protein-like surface antigen